jgi:PAS domain S-box-containing protein
LDYIYGDLAGAPGHPGNIPKLIMLDLKLPKVNGLELLARVKADPRTKLIPVVVLTSSREERDLFKCYELGVNSYIVKPVDFVQFTEAVRQLGLYWLLLNQKPGFPNEPRRIELQDSLFAPLRLARHRYLAAILLAITAQVARAPFHLTSTLPFITYAPLVLISALLGGFGPGLLTTTLCVLEILYFSPALSFFTANDWPVLQRIGAFFATGVVISLLAERLKRDRARLLESHRNTSASLESISDGFMSLDHEWRYTYVNAAAAKMLGRESGELLGKSLWELWPHAPDSPFGLALRRTTAENVTLQVEVFCPEPLYAWFEVRCYPSQEGLSLFITDTTQRKQAEEKSLLFTSIVEQSDDAIISKNLDGIIGTWNASAERIYGYTSEEIVGRHVSLLIPDDRAYELPILIDDLRRGAKIDRYETERVRKNGKHIFVSLTMSPIKDAEQRIVGVSVIGRDITERKLSERALSLSEERYRSLTLATSQIVWNANPQGEMAEDLPMWREFTGQAPAEIRGQGWIDALHPDDRERTADLWSRSVRSRSLYDTEFRLQRHDGEYRYMAVHGVPVLERDGTIREWVGTCADITERVLAEDEVRKLNEKLGKRVAERTTELEAANQELEAFTYSISHDLRAPLRAVDGFSRILLEDYGPQLPAEAQHYLQVARDNALQMGGLIDGLLAFSHLGRQPLRKLPVAPADLVRQVLEDLRLEQTGRRVEIAVGHLPVCEGDPLLLKQVFVNLLSNALKYSRTRENAHIEIAAADSTAYYVRDNGVGFDMRYADKLFGVFQRLHRADEYEGAGVGLAIVQRIVHRHGGRVWAEAAVNQGATFYFTLAQVPECDPSPDESLRMEESGERVTV